MENKNSTGRNGPCPCGSGKKYKNCCFSDSPIDLKDFPEEEALHYYKTQISPGLMRGLKENAEKSKIGAFIHRKLE